jgi:EF-P beta-lysylation protein EpmB
MTWQKILQQAIRDPQELLEYLELPLSLLNNGEIINRSNFNLLVPYSYAVRMQKNNINDPLLKQVLPTINEQKILPNFSKNPVGDLNACKTPGLLHKYYGRVLLLINDNCAINCRYCFRQHYPYLKRSIIWQQKSLAYIAKDSSISEVILSGGDPLNISDEKLANWLNNLAEIPHIKRLRIHSRLPIIIPARITDNLLNIFQKNKIKPLLVLHINHTNELSNDVKLALKKLTDIDIILLNQTVLLKGVNDNSKCLISLSENLYDSGVLPYYLHCLDRVQGAAHFEVAENIAKQLLLDMRTNLSGYLVPKLVREIANIPFKQPL